MATIKSYTNLEQSRKLEEILSLKSADMYYPNRTDIKYQGALPIEYKHGKHLLSQEIAAWSLAALLKYLNEIKSQVYTPILFPSEGKWILQFVEYGHGNVCEVCDSDPIDACVKMIEYLHELKVL